MQTKIAPSPMQQAVIDWVAQGRGSKVVVAVAGSGKTKTIELSLPGIPESAHVQLFAFNKTIAQELNARLEKLRGEYGRDFRNFRASTFHSVGCSAVARKLQCSVRDLQTDSNKMRKLAENHLTPTDYEMYGSFCAQLVGLAKGQGIGAITPDVDGTWYDLIKHHDLFLDSEEATEERAIYIARRLLQDSNKAADNRSIDYDDMLYLPLLWRLRLWQNDWVFVDEAQDTNPVRRALAKLALKPGGRLLAVGDPRQAIYGFTGASHDAIDIIKREFNAGEMPLTVSYRCAKNIVAKAQEIVEYIQSADTAPDGIVHTATLKDALAKFDEHDAILCRNTAPLIQLAYALIARNRPCVVLGREIGAGLVVLVKKLRAKGIEQLEAKLIDYATREVSKFMARGEEQKAEAVSDRVACIRTVIENLGEGKDRTIPRLIERIEGLFSDSNGKLTLCTQHKSKGKEWKRVGILKPELNPSKWARQEWQQLQERNLMYVSWTRAMEELYFLTGDVKDI